MVDETQAQGECYFAVRRADQTHFRWKGDFHGKPISIIASRSKNVTILFNKQLHDNLNLPTRFGSPEFEIPESQSRSLFVLSGLELELVLVVRLVESVKPDITVLAAARVPAAVRAEHDGVDGAEVALDAAELFLKGKMN